MSIERDPTTGKFRSVKPGDEAFYVVTSEMIYKKIEGMDDRLSAIESRLDGWHRFSAAFITVLTGASALATLVYYVR